MSLPLPLRLAGLAAALSGFLAQGVLPAVHAWRVGVLEAAYHASAPEAARRATLSPERTAPHEHHNESDCALCPLFARAGGAAPNAVRPGEAPGTGLLLHAAGLAPAEAPSRPDAPPRGPPALA